MEKKYSMYSNGVVIAHLADGKISKANDKEINEHLASYLPKVYKGEKLESASYDPETGYVHGKYATKKVRKQIFAVKEEKKKCKCGEVCADGECVCKSCKEKKAAADAKVVTADKDQKQPIDGVQKVKETKVPRNESKAKPTEKNITKDRPDVANPKDIDENKVPRSKGNGGLEGGSKTTFEPEKAEKATSGSPDSYVQKFTPGIKPTPAGSETNHTAGTEIKFRSDSEIYPNLKLAKDDKKKKLPWEKDKDNENCDDSDKEIEDKKDDKSKKKLPWEKEDKKDNKKVEKKEANRFEKLYVEAKNELQTKTAEINSMKVREARLLEATKYALALYKLNPTRFASNDDFVKVIDDTAKMNIETIKEAISGLESVQREANIIKKTASVEEVSDGGLATAIVIPGDSALKTASDETVDQLKNILLNGTKLGKMVNECNSENNN